MNLLPFIKGEAPGRPHDLLFWRTDTYRVVRSGDWKLHFAHDYLTVAGTPATSA